MKQLLLAAVVLSTPALAGAEIWINPGFYSYHFDTSKDLNNHNNGLGIEASINPTYSFTAGVFENSNRATSHYMGAYVMPYRVGSFKLGAAVGAFNGYPNMRDGGWFPAIIPTLSIEGNRFGVNVMLTPKITNQLNSALSFQIKFNIAP